MVGPLGQGAMGLVVRAHDTSLRRDVAIKLLPGDAGLKTRERLIREAEALARISHPNVVGMHALLHHKGHWLLVMDYAEGVDLEARLEGGPLSPSQAVELALGLAQGLGALHQNGIVHRDVKPGNVLVSPTGQALLLDLGISKRLDETQALTRTGASAGTPGYMAPEQIEDAKHADARADVYGLGATLYHMLTGSPPLTAESLPELVIKVLQTRPQPPHERAPGVDRFLSEVCLRCLEKEPRDRPDLETLCGELARHQRGRRQGSRASRLPAVAVLVLLLAGVSWAATRAVRPALPDPVRLDQDAKALLERTSPLLDDAAEIQALHARYERLGAQAPPRAASRAHALVGLLALAQGQRERAEASRRRAQELGSSTAARALEAALRQDPRGLSRAIAGGFDRPELRGWRVEARFKEGLTVSLAQEVLEDLDAVFLHGPLRPLQQERRVQALLRLSDLPAAQEALSRLSSPSAALRWSLALAQLDLEGDPAGSLERLESLPTTAAVDEARRVAARRSLQLCASVRREAGPARLGPAQIERERLYLRLRERLAPTEPLPAPLLKDLREQLTQLVYSDDRLGLALAVADAVPDDPGVQAHVSALLGVLRGRDRARLIPVLRRALRLATDEASRLDAMRRLCVTLGASLDRSPDLAAEVVDLCGQVLPQLDDPPSRARILASRAKARRILGRLALALEDYDAAIEVHALTKTYVSRAKLLREFDRPEQALDDLLHYLEIETTPDAEQNRALAELWELARAHGWEARVLPSFERELRRTPERAGWWVRLAWLHARLGDEPAAVASLRQAPDLDLEETTRALAPRLATLQAAFDMAGLEALVAELERLRGSGKDP
jgi:tetratricopeptide (TPR) repeat protein